MMMFAPKFQITPFLTKALMEWVEDLFIVPHGKFNKSRKYELAVKWTELLS
jgi:hypothetical protein